MTTPKLNILLSGMMAADPFQGGATWAVLQYVLGLKQLGHNVCFVEPLPVPPGGVAPPQLSKAPCVAYFQEVVAEFGLQEDATLLWDATQQTWGLSYEQLHRRAARCDLLINISGMLTDENLINGIPLRVYLDLDPAFNQLWQATQNIDMRFDGHTHFVTVGLEIGQPTCTVPTCGRNWIPTLQPIALQYWPVSKAAPRYGLTTVGNWRGYGSIEHEGIMYGQKAHSLRPLMGLPTRTPERFQLGLSIHSDEKDDLRRLAENGWELLNPQEVAGTPDRYQGFIQQSQAEFGIAKSGYVASKCGWFSDRSVCYLASGRPVIAQETGFSRHLPTGAGLFAFTTKQEALAAIEVMSGDYQNHARQARTLAEDYFDSERVLPRLLREIGATA